VAPPQPQASGEEASSDTASRAGAPSEQPPGADAGAAQPQPEQEPAQPVGEASQAEGPDAQPTPLAASDLRAQSMQGDPLATGFAPLGGLGFGSNAYAMQVEFSHVGAGVKSIRLARELDSVRADRAAKEGAIDPERHVLVQGQVTSGSSIVVPLAALAIEIDGGFVPLTATPDGDPVWRQISADRPGAFEAFVVDGAGERVLRLERVYSLAEGSHDLHLSQRIENLTASPMDVRWREFGPVELFADSTYGGEKRRVRFGYLFDQRADPSRQFVGASDFLWPRTKFVGNGAAREFPGGQVWPNERSRKEGYELVWAGMTNRYYAAIAHPVIDAAAGAPDKAFRAVERIDSVVLPGPGTLIMSFHGPSERLAPGSSLERRTAMYAGPLSKELISAEAMLGALGVDGVVIYNFGGMCAFCTFTWLTTPLMGLLRALHGLTSDWGLAIILLVVCVRTLLHPVTRWSQIRMLIFGKQMQGMAPKQKAIQEKYKDDRQKLQQEMAKLWREEGVSPAGFLGCLPMFLQSPVWIALYATLYFAVELRHEPAFFGVFQTATNNAWPFLADLSQPDRFIPFGGAGFTLPLMGHIDALNLLPILLGVVFFIQQKYLTPPTTGAMTPEQEAQQKMMKIMMVVMFPLLMYAAPSGLSLYFITNSTLGILESRWIRSHAEKSGVLEPDRLKRRPREGGFLTRLKQMAEEQQKLQGQRGMSPKRAPRMPSRESGPPQRRYKRR
jgi:YidC/Oxa1 family membrane protein insertase